MTVEYGTKSGNFPFSPAGQAGKDKQKNGA